jgi:hypothetical protein
MSIQRIFSLFISVIALFGQEPVSKTRFSAQSIDFKIS